METIDLIARVVGYATMGFGLFWLISTTMRENADRRYQQNNRGRLNELSARDPESYEREVKHLNNVQRWRDEKRAEIARLRHEIGDDFP